MTKQIPELLIQMARNPEVKQAFYLDYDSIAGCCQNCNGTGFLSLFLATSGPFDEPGTGKSISKFYNGKWWCAPSVDTKLGTVPVFGTVSAECPVCKGKGR